VLAAQRRACAVKPGVAFHGCRRDRARRRRRLLSLGILTGDRNEIVKSRAYQKFYPHGSSHWIGLDVHDVGNYGNPNGVARLERYGLSGTKLEPGMALTVEPGIYIPENSTTDPRWWNIGIRIEDTVLVTAAGYGVFPAEPARIADIERTIPEIALAPCCGVR
jgi:Xaa-Pro aminopeptidase